MSCVFMRMDSAVAARGEHYLTKLFILKSVIALRTLLFETWKFLQFCAFFVISIRELKPLWIQLPNAYQDRSLCAFQNADTTVFE